LVMEASRKNNLQFYFFLRNFIARKKIH